MALDLKREKGDMYAVSVSSNAELRQYLIYIFLKMTGHMMQVYSLIKTVK